MTKQYLPKTTTYDLKCEHNPCYGDAQGDASNAFANAAISKYLQIQDEAVSALNLTGLTPAEILQEAQQMLSVLDDIGGLTLALRSGGPAPEDLEGLSNALEEAIDMAHTAIKCSRLKA